MPQRDPHEQQQEADRFVDDPDLDVQVSADAFVQHVPRRRAEPGLQHEGDADAEHGQASDAAGEAIGPISGGRARGVGPRGGGDFGHDHEQAR